MKNGTSTKQKKPKKKNPALFLESMNTFQQNHSEVWNRHPLDEWDKERMVSFFMYFPRRHRILQLVLSEKGTYNALYVIKKFSFDSGTPSIPSTLNTPDFSEVHEAHVPEDFEGFYKSFQKKCLQYNTEVPLTLLPPNFERDYDSMPLLNLEV